MFPHPVKPPAAVAGTRQNRLEVLQRIAVIGIALRLLVIVVEAIAYWFGGYAALLVDAVASLFDVVSSLALVVAIRYAARPPDEDHPFGHGRLEPLAGLQLGILIAVAGGWLLLRQMLGLARLDPAGEVSPWVWCIPAGAALLMELTARMLRRTANRQQSTAMLAEAGHYRVDALTSLVAATGLLLAAFVPEFGRRIDLTSAAVLAIIMIGLGVVAAWENVHQLIDRVPHDEHFENVRQSALKVEGVLDVEKIRIQHAGPDAHVDIDIEVDPHLNVASAHRITQHVRAQIQADWPFVREVVVHVEPYYEGDH
ncbi:MAG: cation diffusion facilitator family transporter [Planctomycetaceae bacterium]